MEFTDKRWDIVVQWWIENEEEKWQWECFHCGAVLHDWKEGSLIILREKIRIHRTECKVLRM